MYEAGSTAGANPGGQALLHLNPAAQRAFTQLELGDQIAGAGFPVSAIELRTETGDEIGTFPAVGGDYRYITRAELFGLLLDDARRRELPITFGCRLHEAMSNSNAATATFTNGRVVESDVVIGADGVNSTVRAAVDAHATPVYTGQWFVHGEAAPDGTRHSPPKLVKVVRDSTTNHAFGWTTVADGRTYWWLRATAAPLAADSGSGPSCRADLDSFVPGGCPGHHLLSNSPGPFATYNAYAVPPGVQWRSGRLALLGDAVHACSPAASQSVALAAEDAVALASALRGHAPEPGLALYQQMRRARAERAVAAGNPRRGLSPGPTYTLDRDTPVTAQLAATLHRQYELGERERAEL